MSPQPEHAPLPVIPYDRDDDLLAAVRGSGRPQARVYRWGEPAVVIGRGGDQERELLTEPIARDRMMLLQRPGGGCSVVLDPGNLVVAAGLPLPGIGLITRAFAALSGWVIDGLAACGIPYIRQQGVSDLVLDGRKIGGSCVYRTRGLIYYSTTLLLAPDLELVERYLKHPPREPEYRRGRVHRDFMGALHPDPWPGTADELATALEPHLAERLGGLAAGILRKSP